MARREQNLMYPDANDEHLSSPRGGWSRVGNARDARKRMKDGDPDF